MPVPSVLSALVLGAVAVQPTRPWPGTSPSPPPSPHQPQLLDWDAGNSQVRHGPKQMSLPEEGEGVRGQLEVSPLQSTDLKGHRLAPQTLEYAIRRNLPLSRTQACDKREESSCRCHNLGSLLVPAAFSGNCPSSYPWLEMRLRGLVCAYVPVSCPLLRLIGPGMDN